MPKKKKRAYRGKPVEMILHEKPNIERPIEEIMPQARVVPDKPETLRQFAEVYLSQLRVVSFAKGAVRRNILSFVEFIEQNESEKGKST